MSGKVTDSVRNVVLGAAIALAGVSPQAIAGPAQWVPLAPPADTKVFVYGYARTGVQKNNADLAVVDGDSSLGFAATTKLGDDLGAYTVYENSVWTSAGSIVTPALWYTSNPTKFAYVGLKGSWGAMTLWFTVGAACWRNRQLRR
jgi:predicted porin